MMLTPPEDGLKLYAVYHEYKYGKETTLIEKLDIDFEPDQCV